MDKKEQLKVLRDSLAPYKVKVPIYDYFGNEKGNKTLPIWYSDTQKLCFPEEYYDEKEIVKIKNHLEKIIKENNLDLKIEMKSDYWIGGLHCSGYVIWIKEL